MLVVIGLLHAAASDDDSIQPLVTADQLLARSPRGQAVRLDRLTSGPFTSARLLGSYQDRVYEDDPDHKLVNAFLEQQGYVNVDDGCWAMVLVPSNSVHVTARTVRPRVQQ